MSLTNSAEYDTFLKLLKTILDLENMSRGGVYAKPGNSHRVTNNKNGQNVCLQT